MPGSQFDRRDAGHANARRTRLRPWLASVAILGSLFIAAFVIPGSTADDRHASFDVSGAQAPAAGAPSSRLTSELGAGTSPMPAAVPNLRTRGLDASIDSGLASDAWPQFQHDASRSGVAPDPFDMPVAPAWDAGAGGLPLGPSSPIIYERTAYFTEPEGSLSAVDLLTGAPRWQVDLGVPGWLASTPAAGDGRVYAAFVTNADPIVTLFAVDPASGSVAWGTEVVFSGIGSIFTTPALAGGTIAWSVDRTIYLTDAASGQNLWSVEMGDWVSQGPTLAEGLVFAGDASGNLAAFDAATGAPVWGVNVGARIASAPALSDGVLYVGDAAGQVHAVDAGTGSELWSAGVPGDSITMSSPALAEGLLFVGAWTPEGGAVRAFQVSDGTPVWSGATPSGVDASPAYDDGVVFATSRDGSLTAWNAADGAPAQSLALSPAGSSSSIAMAHGYLLAGDDSGTIHAFAFAGAGVPFRVEVSPAQIDLAVTDSALFEAQAEDAYGNAVGGLTFTWDSTEGLGTVLPIPADHRWATFDAGIRTGTDLLTASTASVTGQATVTIIAGGLAAVRVTPNPVAVTAGGAQHFTAEAYDPFGNPISEVAFTWSASPDVGTVSADGHLTAATTVTSGIVTAGAGPVSGQAAVSIVPGPLASIRVSPASLSLSAGSGAGLAASGADAYGNAIEDLAFDWTASSGIIASLDALGRFAHYAAPTVVGPATIRVSSGGLTATVGVSVGPGPLAALTIQPPNPSVAAGGTLTFAASGADVYGNDLSDLDVSWTASAGSFSEAGAFTAPTTTGNVLVTASASGRQATTVATVTPAALDRIAVGLGVVTLETGKATTLVAVGVDAYGNEVPGLAYTWTTSSGTLTPSGDSRFAMFAAGATAGPTTITVSAGGKSTTLTVNVTRGIVPLEQQVVDFLPLLLILLAIGLGVLAAWLYSRNRRLGKQLAAAGKGASGGGGA